MHENITHVISEDTGDFHPSALQSVDVKQTESKPHFFAGAGVNDYSLSKALSVNLSNKEKDIKTTLLANLVRFITGTQQVKSNNRLVFLPTSIMFAIFTILV